ncbi:MAG: hypothetical protein AAGH15_22000 [Myxococcota bacterium]
MTRRAWAAAMAVIALGAVMAGTRAQGPGPVIEATTLLSQRFYPARGGFLIDGLAAAFVARDARGEAVITRGEERVAAVPLIAQPHSTAEAFMYLNPNGTPGVMDVGQPGEYRLTIFVEGQPIGVLPFTLGRVDSGDPFHPNPTFTREGPWSRLGYLSWSADAAADEDPPAFFSFWTSTTEIGGGVSHAPVTCHVLKGRREIAVSRPITSSTADWQRIRCIPKKDRNSPLVRSDFPNGRYNISVRIEDRELTSFPFRVAGGEVQTLPEGRLDHTPRTEMLLPRRITAMSNTGTNSDEEHVFWLARAR